MFRATGEEDRLILPAGSTGFRSKRTARLRMSRKIALAGDGSPLPLDFGFKIKQAFQRCGPARGLSSPRRPPTPPRETGPVRRERAVDRLRDRVRVPAIHARPSTIDPARTPRNRRARLRAAALRSAPSCRCRKAGPAEAEVRRWPIKALITEDGIRPAGGRGSGSPTSPQGAGSPPAMADGPETEPRPGATLLFGRPPSRDAAICGSRPEGSPSIRTVR